MTTETTNICQECGMNTEGYFYHPYAACLMFTACGKKQTVESNLKYVLAEGEALAYAKRNAIF